MHYCQFGGHGWPCVFDSDSCHVDTPLADCTLPFQYIHFIPFQRSQSIDIRFRKDEVVANGGFYRQVCREARL